MQQHTFGLSVLSGGLLLLLAGAVCAQELQVTTAPAPIVLAELPFSVVLRVRALPGEGPVRAAVNVGRVDGVGTTADAVRVLYTTPEERFPQTLCLLLWRVGKRPKVHAVRIPLLGRAVVPVRTRPRSEVRVVVGDRRYGPLRTNHRGRARVEVDVPPGIREARVDVIDKAGLVSQKQIPIVQRAFQPLVLAVSRRSRPDGAPGFRVAVATADTKGSPRLEAEGKTLQLKPAGLGLWLADWDPSLAPAARLVRLRAWLADDPQWSKQIELELPARAAPPVARPAPTRAPAPVERPRRLQGVAGVGVGMLHNTGALLAPRLTAELGLDLRLPVGWLGVRALVGASWASQQIDGPEGLAGGDSSVLLLPVGAGLCYRLPFSLLTPYLLAGLQAQLVRTRASTALLEEDQQDVDWGLAVLGLAGAERGLGPGLVFLQAGFQWGRVDSPTVKMLAGGVVLEAGYRFRL